MDYNTPDILCSACLSHCLGRQLTSLGCVIPPLYANHRGATRSAGCSWCVEIAQPVPVVLNNSRAQDLSFQASLCITLLDTEHPYHWVVDFVGIRTFSILISLTHCVPLTAFLSPLLSRLGGPSTRAPGFGWEPVATDGDVDGIEMTESR
jgi:hypothetical protein